MCAWSFAACHFPCCSQPLSLVLSRLHIQVAQLMMTARATPAARTTANVQVSTEAHVSPWYGASEPAHARTCSEWPLRESAGTPLAVTTSLAGSTNKRAIDNWKISILPECLGRDKPMPLNSTNLSNFCESPGVS